MSLIPLRAPVPPGAVSFVLDASVPLRWCVPDVRNIYPSRTLARMSLEAVAVPAHWYVQLAELLSIAIRAKQTTEASAVHILNGFDVFTVYVDALTSHYLTASTFALARTHKLTVYDAAYIELAARLAVPLATTDHDLTRAATATGVPIFNP